MTMPSEPEFPIPYPQENISALHPKQRADDPPWLTCAFRLLGTKEIKGPGQDPTLQAMATTLGLMNFEDDRDPWCTLFISHCIKAACPDEPLPKHLVWSRAYAKFGIALTTPIRGSIVVTWRGKTKDLDLGHAFFYLEDNPAGGYLTGLGGNQSDSVSISTIHRKDRVVAVRWPTTYPLPKEAKLS